jgi:hypothetical protein
MPSNKLYYRLLDSFDDKIVGQTFTFFAFLLCATYKEHGNICVFRITCDITTGKSKQNSTE